LCLFEPRLRRVNVLWIINDLKSMPVSPKPASKAVLAKPPYSGYAEHVSKHSGMQYCPSWAMEGGMRPMGLMGPMGREN